MNKEVKVDELVDLLNREASIFAEFLDSLEEQKDALVSADTDKLIATTERQRELLALSRTFDIRRRLLVAKLAEQNELEGDLNISRLLEVASVDQGGRLSAVRDTIIELESKLADRSERNAFLINKSRELVAETLKVISRVASPPEKGVGYTRQGPNSSKGKAPRVSLVLDRRA